MIDMWVIQVAIHSYFKLNWHWGKRCVLNCVSHTLGIYNWFPWRSHTCITKPIIRNKPSLTCIWQWNLPSILERECSYRHPKRWDFTPNQLQVFLPLMLPKEWEMASEFLCTHFVPLFRQLHFLTSLKVSSAI